MQSLGRIKPGWYVLVALLIYSIIMTSLYIQSQRSQRILAAIESEVNPSSEPTINLNLRSPQGLWFPIPGASLPQDRSYLPGAARSYRRGINQGFDFYGNDAGIPISYGQPVIASADGIISRADTVYEELDNAAWQALLSKVADRGASEEDLNLLRGRQVWLELNDGRILRYAHLSAIHPAIIEDAFVYRGQVIAYVGNSGTDDGVAGSTRGARLHFEIWQADGTYFGQNLDSEAAVRSTADALFVGP